MTFKLTYTFHLGDDEVSSTDVAADFDKYREHFADADSVSGEVSIDAGGKVHSGDYSDPLVRLIEGWMRKVPWIIGGDTETIALRNSEECFAFERSGASVEISFFSGTELEIEEYIIQPLKASLEDFVGQSIALGEQLVDFIKQADAEQFESSEDCRDLAASVDEAKRSWHEHELHQRR